MLTDRGLEPAIEALAARAPLPVSVAVELEERLPEPVEAAAYYVVAEALTNAAKHARASEVAVRVARENGFALIEVADDGVGGAATTGGSGLRGLADRVEALGGGCASTARLAAGRQSTPKSHLPDFPDARVARHATIHHPSRDRRRGGRTSFRVRAARAGVDPILTKLGRTPMVELWDGGGGLPYLGSPSSYNAGRLGERPERLHEHPGAQRLQPADRQGRRRRRAVAAAARALKNKFRLQGASSPGRSARRAHVRDQHGTASNTARSRRSSSTSTRRSLSNYTAIEADNFTFGPPTRR